METVMQLVDRVNQMKGVIEGLKVAFTGGSSAGNQLDITAGAAMRGRLTNDHLTDLNKALRGVNAPMVVVEAAAGSAVAYDGTGGFAALGTGARCPAFDAPVGTRGKRVFVWLKTDGTFALTDEVDSATAVDADGMPVAPEAGPDIFSGVFLTSNFQKGPIRKAFEASVLLAEVYCEVTTRGVYDANGGIATAQVMSAPKIDNWVARRYVSGPGPRYYM